MITSLRITLPGEPHAQGRPRAFKTPGGFIRLYDPASSRNWKATAQEHFITAMREAGEAGPLLGPVEVTIRAVFTCPKTDYRKNNPRGQRPHAKRPDAENVAKAVLDAGTGVLYADDAQVCELKIEKVIGAQGEAPRVEVTVWSLEPEPHPAAKTIQPAPLLPDLGVGA